MKKLATVFLMVMLGTFAQAETVLICHAQSVPAVLDPSFHSTLSTKLLDKVFDYFFNKGDITFDTAFSLSDGVPTSNWLGNLSGKYGADKVVYYQVIWKQGAPDEAVLDRVDYQVVSPQGKVLREGSFTVELTSPSKEEVKQTEVATGRMIEGLTS